MNVHTFTHKGRQTISLYHSNAMHRCVQTKSTQGKYSAQLHCSVLWMQQAVGAKAIDFTGPIWS